MSFNLDLRVSPKDLKGLLPKQRKAILKNRKRALLATAVKGSEMILERTAKGIGYKGAFAEYSDRYAKFRRATGRSTTPDLLYSGKMLGNMTQKANSNQAVIFFSRSAEAKKAAMNNDSRPFMGFDRKESQELSAFFSRKLL
jgi:phage gpG-like protein